MLGLRPRNAGGGWDNARLVTPGSDRQALVSTVTRPPAGVWARIPRVQRAPLLTALQFAAPLALIGALAWPLLFTGATFNEDWLNHLWYLWHQSRAIDAERLPSLFLDYSGGVLYPFYAFYGGTLYALAGMLSLVLGDAPLPTYILTYLLGFAAAYGGWLWLARMFGLRGWRAHTPGVVYVTSASYLMLIYAIGDWPEFTAVSTIPLTIAAGLSVLRADRLRVAPAAALAAGSVLFFGSHLLTAIWGSTVLALTAGALLLCVPEARRRVTRAGVLRVAAIVLPALAANAWFLLPTVAYEAHTTIAHSYPHFRELLRKTSFVASAENLFSLSRSPVPGAVVYAALPVLAIAWTLVSVAGSWQTRRRGAWLRVFLVLAIVSTFVLVLMDNVGLILALPRMYATLQFSFRLESYVLLGASGAMLAALVLARDGGRFSRAWAWLLLPLAIFSIAGALDQVGSYQSGTDRSAALSSYIAPTFEQEGLLDYVDDSLPIWKGHPLPKIQFAQGELLNGRAAQRIHEPPGQLVKTNIRSGPELVDVTGARIVGTDSEADDIVEVDRPRLASGTPAAGGARRSAAAHAPRDETITVAPADPPPVLIGRIVSALGLTALALELLWAATWRLRQGTPRRRRS